MDSAYVGTSRERLRHKSTPFETRVSALKLKHIHPCVIGKLHSHPDFHFIVFFPHFGDFLCRGDLGLLPEREQLSLERPPFDGTIDPCTQ